MAKPKSDFVEWMSSGSRVTRVVKRVALIVALLYASVGGWAAYRAWVQVRTLELRVVSATLRPGAPSLVRVVTSGRTYVDVKLELIQGTQASTLADLRVAPTRNRFFDPRSRQGTMMPSFTTEFLAQFQPGPAILRATATGTMQLFRTPAPVVQETAVIVAAPGQ